MAPKPKAAAKASNRATPSPSPSNTDADTSVATSSSSSAAATTASATNNNIIAATTSSRAPSTSSSNVDETHKATNNNNDVSMQHQLFDRILSGELDRNRDILVESMMLYSPDGKTKLIDEARLQFVYGRKYGLVGRNGSGKSSLLRAVHLNTIPGLPQHIRIVYVEQEEIFGDQRPTLQFVIDSDEEKNWLEQEQEQLYDVLENGDDDDESFDADAVQARIDRIDERLIEIDARRIEVRAQQILTGLGFTKQMQQKPVSELSGGWRRRVAMACALLISSDVMLLDEPTNHLDFAAVEWLQAYLKTVACTLVVVSHDRDFLNAISTDIIWLHHKKLDYYRGDYEQFVKVRDEILKAQQHQYEVQQKKIEDAKQFINEAKQSSNPDKARLAVTRQKMLDKMLKEELIEAPDVDREFAFKFPTPGKLDHALLECSNMDFAYDVTPEQVTDDTKMLLHDVTVNLTIESRVAVLGHNGAGKTTLIKLIMGKLKPLRGLCRFNDHARAAYFTQHHVDQLNVEMTPLEYLQSLYSDAKEYQIRAILGRFGFDAQLASQKIATLSGGQKSRVAFAVLTWKEPHLIILDEPTNHLDSATIDALIGAIKAFEGAVIVISHDTHFVHQVADEYWAVAETGEVKTFFDLDEAKVFAYKPITFDIDETLKRSNKQQQDLLLKATMSATSKNNETATREESTSETMAENGMMGKGKRVGGKQKKKSAKGKGGIDVLAEEKERLAEEKALTEASLRAQEAAKARKQTETPSDIPLKAASTTDTKPTAAAASATAVKPSFTSRTNGLTNQMALLSMLDDTEEGNVRADDEPKKKRKSKKSKEVVEDDTAELDEEAEAERRRRRKEKKRLKELAAQQAVADDEENLVDVNDLPPADADMVEPLKSDKAQKKHSRRVSFAAEDEVADECVADSSAHDRQKSKAQQLEDGGALDVPSDEDVSSKKKSKAHKKKSSKSVEEDNATTETADVDVDADADAAVVKKAKKKSSSKHDSSDLIPADEVELERRKREKKKAVAIDEEAADEENVKPAKSKSKSSSSSTRDSDDDVEVKPKKKSSKTKSKEVAADVNDDAVDVESTTERKQKKKKSKSADTDDVDDADVVETKARKKKSKPVDAAHVEQADNTESKKVKKSKDSFKHGSKSKSKSRAADDDD